ncbi:NAD-binding protein [Myceligenerans crystallogenes]|uniref:NAD-binding protein n=1 Tax=Myceligenerans crystallogenes TaxID=316335 RepID=A0ABN2NJ45_9MICO
MATPAASERPHYVVCGANPLMYRMALALVTRYGGTVGVVLPDAGDRYARTLVEEDRQHHPQRPRVTLVEAVQPDRASLQAAGLDRATSVALLDQDDGGNVNLALLVDELRPGTRQIVRIFDEDLGDSLTEYLPNCRPMSSSRFAAPEVVARALREPTRLDLPGRRHVVTRQPAGGTGSANAVPLFAWDRTHPESKVEALPQPGTPGVLYLEQTAPPGEPKPVSEDRLSPVFRQVMRHLRTDRILQVAAIVLAVLILVASLVYLPSTRSAAGPWAAWGEALYDALLTLVGGTDPHGGDIGARLMHILLTLLSVVVVPLLTAALVDVVIKARLQLDRGELTEAVAGHVVVVGLSDLGTRVVEELHGRGVDVVAVDLDEQARGVAVARELHVPVVIGDASRSATLRRAYVHAAQAVVVVTGGHTNTLGIAFAADSLDREPGASRLRVVMRVFDKDTSRRLSDRLNGGDPAKHGSFRMVSASHLSAPHFAAAMIGQDDLLDTVAFRDRVLIAAQVPLAGAGHLRQITPMPLRTDLDVPGAVRVVQVRTARATGGAKPVWLAPAGGTLEGIDAVTVLATAHGLRTLQEQVQLPAALRAVPHVVRRIDVEEDSPLLSPARRLGRRRPAVASDLDQDGRLQVLLVRRPESGDVGGFAAAMPDGTPRIVPLDRRGYLPPSAVLAAGQALWVAGTDDAVAELERAARRAV